MSALLVLWARRLWPYLVVLLLVGAGIGAMRRFVDRRALQLAHDRTAVATAAAARADTVFRLDTVERRVLVRAAQASRAVALRNLADTIGVKQAFRQDSLAESRSDSTISQAARTLGAHLVVESALRTELTAAERLRVPRYRVSSEFGIDIDGQTPVTGIEAEVRVAARWSIVGRIDKRWTPGETSRRQLLLRYSLGR